MRPSIRRPVLALAPLVAALVACASGGARAAGGAPASGEQLVSRMRERYEGRWFRTLTFTQRTTRRLPDGTERVSTWLEASEAPDKLRIDMGPRGDGNGALVRGDSTYRIVGGKVTRAVATGNPFLPFVVGIYTQPLDRTLGELARDRYDLTRVRLDQWRGRAVQVVGASSPADTTSPQFWVDLDRLVTVRVLLPAGDASGAVQDLRLDGYRRFGSSWVATEISILVGGTEVQREEYADVRVNVPLSPALFDPAAWSSAPHWAAGGEPVR